MASRRRNPPTVAETEALGIRSCRKCELSLPLEQFYKVTSNRSRVGYTYTSWCKPCYAKEAHIRWLKKIADPAGMVAYRARINRYRMVTGYQRNYQAIPENKEKLLAAGRRWAKANPDKVRMKCATRRARRKGASEGKVDLSHILERDKHTCHICGEAIPTGQLSYDHVIPLAKGGKHSTENIRCSHILCNTRKRDYMLVDLFPVWIGEALASPA